LARRHSSSPLRRSGRRRARPVAPAEPDKEAPVVLDAVLGQALPNVMFEVVLEGGHKLIAYTAGRMRRYRIRLTPGDRIRVELSPYDLDRGRIVYRYRD
jgi:translation initiation factor IF-1